MRRSKLHVVFAAIVACLTIFQVAAAGEFLGHVIRHKSTCEPRSGSVVECDAACKVCKPVPDKKKVTKVVYEYKDEWYCLPKCPCPRHVGKHDCCEPCTSSCPMCEKPRCRRVLVKKIITEEKPTTKCVVE
jgi:hypothetical protein